MVILKIEEEVRAIAKRVVMEEVNNLGVRAAVKELILDAGITKENIRQTVADVIESHFKSAMNVAGGDVDAKIAAALDQKITDLVSEKVSDVLNSPFRSVRLDTDDAVKKAIAKEAERYVKETYNVSLDITPKLF